MNVYLRVASVSLILVSTICAQNSEPVTPGPTIRILPLGVVEKG